MLLPYLRLLRLPNVCTAFSNVLMGFFFVHDPRRLSGDWPVLALLLAASGGMYLAGMVLNDVFDIEVDRRERPFRPLPSGKVSLTFATWLGWSLLVLGTAAGAVAGYVAENAVGPRWLGAVISLALAVLVVAYNGVLKNTAAGPFAMGGCRLLNVLLGMSVPAMLPAGDIRFGFTPAQWLVAGAMGLYVLGITVFARGEAGTSRRGPLLLGLLLMGGGLAMLACLPWLHAVRPAMIRQQPQFAVVLFALLGFSIVRRAMNAIIDPDPERVQATVKHALLSIIVLDAAVALLVASPACGAAIICLMVPAYVLGRWIYST